MSILLKILTLKWNISRTIWRIEVSDGSFFRIFHALSFEPNFVSTGGSLKKKKNITKSHIRKLLIDNQALSDPTTILQEIKGFYNSLNTRKSLKTEQECLSYLNDINTPLLSEHESLSCEGKLILKEIYQALESMPGNNSPGLEQRILSVFL